MQTCDLTWLPPLLEFGGEWSSYCEKLYAVFTTDFMGTTRPSFRGRPVSAPWRNDVAGEGKSGTFWHLVSEGGRELDRTPDMRRCERLPWIRALIEAADDGRICVWVDTERGDRRWKIALSDYSYVVILADRGKYLTVITAFHIEREHQREKLSDEHKRARAAEVEAAARRPPKSSKPPSRR